MNLVTNAAILAKDRNALHLDTVLDNAGRVAAGRKRRTLDTSPSANTAAPSNNGVQNTCVVLNLGVLQHDTLLDTGTGANNNAGSDADVGAELGGGMDVGGRVDEDGGNNVGAGGGEFVAANLRGLLEIQRVGGHRRAGGLDLAPEILGLVDEELLAVGHVTQNVLLEADGLLLVLVTVIVGNSTRHGEVIQVVGGGVGDEAGRAIGATLNGRSDGREDGIGGEEVDAAVDQVADVRLGLFNVVEHSAGVGVGHDATKVGGGFVADAGAEDDGLCVSLNKELEHLLQRERAADVGVEDKEALGAALEDGISEVVQTAGGAQGLVLAQISQVDAGELLGRVLDEVAEDGLVVVADDVDVLDLLDAGNGRQAVPDDGVAGDFEEGLGEIQRERTESRATRGATDLESRTWELARSSISSS